MKAVRVGDIGTEHDGYHPTKVTAGSGDVFIDGKPAALTGGEIDCGGVTIGDQPPPSMSSDVISSTPQASTYDEQLRILDPDNNPIEGYPYYAKTVEGKIYSGRTNAAGMTCRIPTHQPEHIKVLCGDEALAEGGDL
ncbi:PAAR domain-containing protein [Halodesulfovibrio aestuarii]|uniref:PAAR domain-containing protein n=1 Tax=Halodesulfovibrio aestuarii TaxID=126333 RepID=A0ABV4JVA0_9BACT